MKTKIKRHSRAVLSIVLTLCMLVSCMTVGIIATDAANDNNESVGALPSKIYFIPNTDWYNNGNVVMKANFNNNDSSWNAVAMTLDDASTRRYSVDVPSGVNKVQFLRGSTGTWKQWDYSKNQTIPTDGKNLFTLNSGWSDTSGTWSTYTPAATTTTLTTPTIAFDNSGAVNSGDSAILRVSNHQTITGQGDSTMSYELYKNNTKMTSGYSYNEGVFTITSYADGDLFTVKAVTTDTAHYTDSAMSDAATLAVYEPKYALLGCANSDSIENIINSQASHASTKAYGWPTTPVDDETHFNSTVVVDEVTPTPGVYKITFTTKAPSWDINIGLYQKTVGQRGFSYDGTDYTSPDRGKELKVPSAGLSNVGIIDGTSSMQFKPNITYTITIDQTGTTDVLSITSDAADITAIARVKTFNPTTGEPNTSVSNATAAVGTATASPSAGTGTFTSNLTAEVADNTKYDFAGWYTDADCTTLYNANATTTATVSTDITYYALFTQKTPDTVNLTIATTGSGTVTPTSGTHSGSGSSYTIYPGATVVFNATPDADYELSSATSTSGTVTKSGNTVTVSNITEAATVSFTFTEVQTYDVTLSANSSSYGSLKATYVDRSGSSVTTSAITGSTTIAVKQGEVVSLKATAGDSGNFDGWTVNSGTYQRSSLTPLSAAEVNIMPTSDLSMTANFSFMGTSTAYKLLRSTTNNDPRQMSDSGLTVYNKSDGYYVTIPASSMNGTNNVYFAISGSTSYTDMWNQNNGDTISVSVASGSASYIEAATQNYGISGKSYNFARARLKDSSVSNVTLHMWHTNDAKTLNYEFSVGGSGSGDDTPDVSGLTKLYVLDGVDMDGNVGTNSFGDSTIISANSGVVKYNYYDATGADSVYSTSTGHSEGGLIYYYDPTVDLDFRVQTTIASGHRALGVRAFVMNGMTYPAKKDKDGNYYADITLDANTTTAVLEVIPVYYNTLIEANGDYIKFYVDANTIGDKFGKTIGYSVWYKNTAYHGETGGYPGQPLLSDGTLLYGYFPKYYVDNNATTIPAAADRSAFAGVLLSNLAEHNDTHKDVLTAWGASTANYQSFDYEDPVEISEIDDVDMIEFVAKYKTLTTTHRYDSSYNARNLNGTTGKSWPASITRPTSAATALSNGFEYLTNIDGKRVNIFNETGTLTGDPLYVVSVGNQQVSPNDWDTVWEVYTSSGTSIAAARPVDFINPSSALQTALQSYTNSPVLINYEGWLAGENNTGTRLDGRWLYSKSTDDTTLRLRVATKDNSGNLTFMTDGITWAEINDGTHNGALEAADTSNLTKILELDNRTTEVTAKINPVGYTVEGMYMLGAAYSDDANNGYSTKISDYDDLNVTGTATSFVNAKDNRMVIVVKQIPATDLVITHQMYGGPGAHKIKGFYYVKAELLNSGGTTVKTYNSGNYTNKPLTLSSFTTDAPKNGGYKLKVTIRTVMSGSASFNQWYENDHNNGYNEIDSTAAHGSTDPVEKEIIVDVDPLYGESTLNIRNLDYYSDLQAAGSVNINHLLLPATISAGLSGTAYSQVTVVNSSGNAVSGGSYAAKARTSEVSSDFITADNANDGYQLKVEIWTIPDSPAEFDAFYKNTTTEMTTHVDGTTSIAYTTGQTKTFAGNTYTSATVMIPIRYFFKEVWDEDEQTNVLQFDSTKQNFYLYSSLKIGYKYSLHFDFQGYRNLYGNLGYDVAETEFTAKELEDYFVLSDSVIDTNNDTVTAYTFKDDDARNAFINLKAPYENTFMETVKWQTDMYGQDHPEGMTATYSSSEHKWSFVVKLKKTDDRYAFVTLRFPYAVKNYDPDKHAPQTSTVTIDGQSTNAVVKLTNDEYNEYGGRSTTTTNYRTGYGSNYFISGSYLTAADKVWNTTDQQWEYFDYWKVENVGDSKTGSAEYTRCYYPEFNLSLYQDSILTPIYTTRAEGMSPSQRAAADDDARTDTYSTGGRATITLMENSRMQWTGGRAGNTLSGTYENGGDRIYTDFLVSYTYGDKQLNTETDDMNAGIVIETVRDLDMEGGEYVTKTQAEYKTSDDSTINKANIKAFAEGEENSALLKTEFSVTTLDNKNRKNHYYSLPNISQTSHNPTERKNKLYRAYSYLKDKDDKVLLISDPIYFTIYDIASIENMSAGAEYGGVS